MKSMRLALLTFSLVLLAGQSLSAQSTETAAEPLATLDASFQRSDLGVLQAELLEAGIAFRYDNMDYLNGKLVGLFVSFRRVEDTSTPAVKGYYSFTNGGCKLWLLEGALVPSDDSPSNDDTPAHLQIASNC